MSRNFCTLRMESINFQIFVDYRNDNLGFVLYIVSPAIRSKKNFTNYQVTNKTARCHIYTCMLVEGKVLKQSCIQYSRFLRERNKTKFEAAYCSSVGSSAELVIVSLLIRFRYWALRRCVLGKDT